MQLFQEEMALLLSECPLFQGVEAETLAALAGQAGVEQVSFAPGETVYSPRKFRRCLGVVLSGQLQVSKGALSVSVLRPGELFGAAALYGEAAEFASTITARRFSRCMLLEQDLVDRLLAEQREIRENYLCYLTGRIRFLAGRLQTLAQPGAEGKLARYLLSSGESTLTCSAALLSRRLGMSRSSLYRAFAALEEAGLIVREGKTIHIADHSGLELI